MKDYDREASLLDEEPDEGGGTVDGECVLVPDGMYELAYVDYETAIYFGTPRVIVHLSIVKPDDFAGLPVDRFYNVKMLSGPPRRFGDYIARSRGNLIREYHMIIGEPERRDRISFKQLRGKRIIGEIETVTTDYKREPLPIQEHYSRVSRLVKVLPDEDW